MYTENREARQRKESSIITVTFAERVLSTPALDALDFLAPCGLVFLLVDFFFEGLANIRSWQNPMDSAIMSALSDCFPPSCVLFLF